MTITKKHLKELADIVHKAQKQAQRHKQESLLAKMDLEEVAEEIKSFAKRHAPNFDESRWNDHMHKRKQEDELANLITRQDELRANNKWNMANDLSPKIAGLKRSLGIRAGS